MSIRSFSAYRPHKKDEDARPISVVFPAGEAPTYGFSVVADGLGGSGSSLHEIPVRDFEKRMRGSAFRFSPILASSSIERKVEECLEEMKESSDGGLISHTSAYFASRIASIRLSVFLEAHSRFEVNDEFARQAFEYAREGLIAFAEEYGLDVRGGRSIRLLPTTMACLIYRESKNSPYVETHVIWSGDSRAYRLDRSGLYPLSVDHEDENGFMTALLTGEKDESLVVSHRRYLFKKRDDAVVFLTTDGLFDPFEEVSLFGVGNILMKSLLGSRGLESWASSCVGYLDNAHRQSDDIAIAGFLMGRGGLSCIRNCFTFKPMVEPAIPAGTKNPEAYLRRYMKKKRGKKAIHELSRTLAYLEGNKDVLFPRKDGREKEERISLIEERMDAFYESKYLPRLVSLLMEGGNDPSISVETMEAINESLKEVDEGDFEKKKGVLRGILLEKREIVKNDYIASILEDPFSESVLDELSTASLALREIVRKERSGSSKDDKLRSRIEERIEASRRYLKKK